MSRGGGADAPKSGADLIRAHGTQILAEGETNMSTAEMMEQIADRLPRHRAQVVVAYYLLTILTGVFVLSFHGRLAFAADLIATVFYIAMTALFYAFSKHALSKHALSKYDLSKPANRRGEVADPVAPRDGRKRPTLAAAGWRSPRAPLMQSLPHGIEIRRTQ
jgi:hypothetical protein